MTTPMLDMINSTVNHSIYDNAQCDFIDDICCSCNAYDGLFRCLDCSCSKGLQCCKCILNGHKYLPLHRIETWTGTHFDRILLQVLGLQIQLGNHRGTCPFPVLASTNFLVFDINGIHPVSVNFCGCITANQKHIQLMRAKFQHVFCIWHNLHALKCAGCGHDPAGPDATATGELAVECPACPQPDHNLPADWQLKEAFMFLYILYIAVDANFKLKMKNCGIKDVELSPGWGTFVNEEEYQQHLSNYVDQPEVC
ncbi:hypothetical protein BDQ17DRAFT_1394682 [Cyathus striatus]|nr:hypothetical protein BDQ17DRAFT_1394682 [Cyathus striatus]